MPWEKTLPSTSTTVRNYPSVITGNNKAIEEGEDSLKIEKVNLADRSTIPSIPMDDPPIMPGDDPAIQLYSKQIVTNIPELFLRDTVNDPIQFSSDGLLGSPTTNFVINNFQFSTNETVYNSGNIVKARGSFNSTGGVINVYNMATVAYAAPGLYTVSVSADVLEVGSDYQVVATATSSSSGNARTLFVVSKATPAAATDVNVQLKLIGANGVAQRAESFDILVTGGV